MEFNATLWTVPRSAEPSEVQFCMICLDTRKDCKLYPIDKYNLDMEFENLTGISLQDELFFVPQFCTICAQRLNNSNKLRDKCLKAYHLVLGLVEMNKLLTTQTIKAQRISNNLASSIGKKSFQPDHCDLYLIHNEQEKIQELPNNKTITIGIINGNKVLIVNPVPRNEKNIENEVVEPKTKHLNDIQTDSVDFYLDDNIQTDDLDIDIDTDVEHDDDDDEIINDKVTEVKSLDSKLMINPDPKNENNVKKEVEEVVVEETKYKTEKIDDIIIEAEFLEEIHDDIMYSDTDIESDTQGAKRVKVKVDKFMDDVVNDTDNDWDFLKDSDSDSNETENAKAQKIKENNERLRRKLARRKAKNPVILEYLKQYKITDLTYEEQLADIQKRKEKDSFENSPYKCMTCFKGAMNIDTYYEHMERHTDKYGKSVCLVCGIHFKCDRLVRQHVKNTHSVRYSCKSCPFVTNHKGAAKTHAAMHKSTVYKTCPHCSMELHSKNAYLSHLRKVHPAVVVCCALCGFSFVTKRGLDSHLNLKHHGETLQNLDGPLCENCNIRFGSEKAYRQHIKVFCKQIDSGERNPSQWQNYYWFYSNTSKPQKRSCKGWCLCDQCGKGFPSPGLLWKHSQVHRGEKMFKCEICHKGFMNKPTLKHHMLNTHGDNPPRYPCGVCRKEFTLVSNRSRHMATHQGTRTLYKCDACNKTFTSLSGLEQHVSHVHGNVPWPKRNRRDRRKANTRRCSVTTNDEDTNTINED